MTAICDAGTKSYHSIRQKGARGGRGKGLTDEKIGCAEKGSRTSRRGHWTKDSQKMGTSLKSREIQKSKKRKEEGATRDRGMPRTIEGLSYQFASH